jgi:ribosomal protein S1
VLKIDRERERIALGMKQKSASPWENITEKYPVGKRINGEVVNLMSYGAFVKLEDGVEGLVHISEMSWTKRVNHPNEVVKQGDKVEVVVLEIDTEKQTISLGMKQTEVNPWDMVAENYPPGTVIRGKVRNLTNYGAFIELQEGIDGLLHITDMSWTRKITNPSEVVKKGDEIECVVLSVDQEKKRIALGLKQLQADPWSGDIPGSLPHRRQRPGHGHEDHQLRCVRGAGAGARRPAAHLGAGRPQGRQPRGSGQGRPRASRSSILKRRHRRAEDRPDAGCRARRDGHGQDPSAQGLAIPCANV